MAYAFTLWTFYILYREYKVVATMRLNFLASEERRPDQFTVRSPSITCTVFILAQILLIFINFTFYFVGSGAKCAPGYR